MLNIKEFMTEDHRNCDEIFAQMEDADHIVSRMRTIAQ